MSVRVRRRQEDGSTLVELLDDDREPVEVVAGFLRFLGARDCSPNTLVSYAYDLRHLWCFFGSRGLSWERFVTSAMVDAITAASAGLRILGNAEGGMRTICASSTTT